MWSLGGTAPLFTEFSLYERGADVKALAGQLAGFVNGYRHPEWRRLGA